MELSINNPLLVILGPTASGKTELAVKLADYFNGEIISADSRQVYRGLDIGTGKDLNLYNFNGKQIKYHLIDCVDAGEKYNLHLFKEDFQLIYNNLISNNKLPILCGGTGLYIQNVLQEYPFTSVPIDNNLRSQLEVKSKEELLVIISSLDHHFMKVDLTSHKRIIRAIEICNYLKSNKPVVSENVKYNYLVIGLKGDRSIQREKIRLRLENRIEEGLIQEVEELLKSNISFDILTYYGLEYKFVAMYLKHEISKAELVNRLFNAICQYAKRQETYFRKMEKDGIKIEWIDISEDKETLFIHSKKIASNLFIK